MPLMHDRSIPLGFQINSEQGSRNAHILSCHRADREMDLQLHQRVEENMATTAMENQRDKKMHN